MSTLNQIRANQQNAQLSTGPRSVEGKAVVRRNALKSGIHARAETALPFENPQDLEDLKNGHYELYNPTTIVECGLVDDLVRDRWLLNRYAAIQGQLLSEDWIDRYRQEHPELSLGHAWGNKNQILARLTRCITATRKSYAETFATLKKLKAEAAAERAAATSEDAPTRNSDGGHPLAVGFVPQTPEAPAPPPSAVPPADLAPAKSTPLSPAESQSTQPAHQSATPSPDDTSIKIGSQQSGQGLSQVPESSNGPSLAMASSDAQPPAVGFVPPSPPDPVPDTATRL